MRGLAKSREKTAICNGANYRQRGGYARNKSSTGDKTGKSRCQRSRFVYMWQMRVHISSAFIRY